MNNVDYSDETLVVPEGSTFGPEDGADDIDYTFEDYEIGGEIQTDRRMSLTATNGDITIKSGGTAISGRQIQFTANNGNIIVDGATIETTAGDGGQGNEEISFETNGDVSAVGASMETGGSISIDAGGSIDLTDASLTVTGSNQDITLTASEDIILVRATLDIQGGGNPEASATVTTGVIDVTEARFLGGADPLSSDGTVQGTPDTGSVA